MSTKLLASSVDEWADFSMNPQPYEEIKKRALLDAYDNKHRLCYAYISRFQNLNESQIEELMVITSPLYTRMSSLTTENIRIATSILSLTSVKEQADHIKMLLDSGLIADKRFKINLQLMLNEMKDKKKNGFLQDRLDWKEIGKRKYLSPGFRKKYAEIMKAIPHNVPRTKNQPLSSHTIKYRGKKKEQE